MHKLKNIFIFIIILYSFQSVYAEIHETNGHNADIYKKDIEILNRKVKQNPSDLSSLKSLIRIYYSLEEFRKAIDFSDKYLAVEKNKEILYIKINSLANISWYKSAINNINTLLSEYDLTQTEKDLLNQKLELYKSSLEASPKPSSFKKASWGSKKSVIGIYCQKNILIGFDHETGKPFFFDLSTGKFIPEFNDSIFSGLDFGKLISFSISPDNREIIASVRGNSYTAKILHKQFINKPKSWSPWIETPVLNKGAVNAYPNFIPGAGSVVFVSDRDPANGLDIYVAKKEKDEWLEPVKLDDVNTSLDESSVMIDPGADVIYFSANGRQGSGGYDLFSAYFYKENNKYTVKRIRNITGMNTFRNEIDPPHRVAGTNIAYVNFLKNDEYAVYTGEINLTFPPVTFMDIFVSDNETKEPLPAEIKIIGNTDGTVYENFTDETGMCGFLIRPGSDYEITISSPGYMYRSGKLVIHNRRKNSKTYYLEKGRIEKGYSFTADNIYFDTGSSVIRDESFPALERLYDFIVKNPGIKINITGNTDNVGTYDFNMRLSYERALSIVEYLTAKGIDRSRMVAIGLGFTKNIAPNTTESGRQKNRRVEIKVVSSD